MLNHVLVRLFAMLLAMLLVTPVSAKIWDSVPDEQLKALELDRNASPKALYEALSERYKAELSKGKLAQWWEPIPMDQYLAPTLFYSPPPGLDMQVNGSRRADCQQAVSQGWGKSWARSGHANLEEIRGLPARDVPAYKKDIIAEVESTLHSLPLLASDRT